MAVYVFMGIWSLYLMGWRWWHEVAPRIEAQRIARITLSTITSGTVDSTAGTYQVGSATYTRRNGIYGATSVPSIPSLSEIDFGLEPDGSNVRSFYLGTDEASGLKALYYKDSNSVRHKIKATSGLTDLKFEKLGGIDNIIKVTATVEKTVLGTRNVPYEIKVVYDEVVYLRNVL